ncbi:SPFH domain-containing protein [Streptomyces sp. NPDC046931]|uniref:SPFH domain-containing protein n=1 Tax=Streptomyces sp. NPDC046931 TaxID=3154806 RepID=UPI0033D540A5
MKWLLLLVLVAALAAGAYVVATGTRRVPTGHLGVVRRRFGVAHPEDRFKVRTHGTPGPQAQTLEADRLYFRPHPFFEVKYVPQTYVPPGTIGVVVAKAGSPPPLDRMLCRHVECDYFQDGRAFLLGGGQQGRQPGILPGGAYYDINPLLFEVLTVDTIEHGRHDLTAADLREITIPEGATGVVIALEGVHPDESDGTVGRQVPGHESFQRPSVFLDNGGQRGAQAETLTRGGVYRINPWFARIVLIPTRDLILEWRAKDDKPDRNFDASLGQIVINVEGHRLRAGMTQTIRIPAKAAPRLVGRFGEQEGDTFGASSASDPAPVQRFVERVLGRTVEGYFQGIASSYDVLDFITGHNEVRLELEERVRQSLAEWGVEAVRTTLTEFEPENSGLDEFRREIATERDRKRLLEHRHVSADLEAKTELIRIDTEKRRRRIEVTELEEKIRVLGRDTVALERFLAQLAKMNVPEFVGGDADSLLQYLPLPVARDMINRALRRVDAAESSVGHQQLDAGSARAHGRQDAGPDADLGGEAAIAPQTDAVDTPRPRSPDQSGPDSDIGRLGSAR